MSCNAEDGSDKSSLQVLFQTKNGAPPTQTWPLPSGKPPRFGMVKVASGGMKGFRLGGQQAPALRDG